MQVDAREVDGGFARFCRDAHPRLVAALTFQCGDRFLAEELAQEALIRAGDRWDSVAGLDSPLGWTYRVGANLASSSFRRRGAERRALARVGERSEAVRVADGGDTVAVQEALAGLTVRQRQVVVLRYYLELTAEETAEVLGLRAGAVRMLAHRAFSHLREELGEQAEEVHDG